MKRNVVLCVAALLALSCTGPLDRGDSDKATVKIGFSFSSSDASRTVVPNFASYVQKITVTFKQSGYKDVTGTDDNGTPWELELNVPQGTWNIEVSALNAAGDKIGSGSKSAFPVTISGGTAVIPITFSDISSTTGSISFKVSFPHFTDDREINYVHGQIVGGASQLATLTTSGVTTTGAFSFGGLATGTYSLVLTFKRDGASGTNAGVFMEKLLVTAGYTSDHWVKSDGTLGTEHPYTEGDFFGNNPWLKNLTIPGLAFTFQSDQTEYLLDPMLTVPATITITPEESAEGQSIKYCWSTSAVPSTDFTDIRTGTPVTLTTAESNTLQIRVTAPDRSVTTRKTYTVTFNKGYEVTVVVDPYNALSFPTSQTVTVKKGDPLTFKTTLWDSAEATSWHWYEDGALMDEDSSFEWNTTGKDPGQYIINVDAMYQGKPCTGSIKATVTY